MKRPIRIILAVFLILVLYILWMGVGAVLFGWRHGGGAIPMMLFFALATFVWRTITKKTPSEKGEVTTINGETSKAKGNDQ